MELVGYLLLLICASGLLERIDGSNRAIISMFGLMIGEALVLIY